MDQSLDKPHRTVFFGTYIHSKTLQKLEICENAAIGVGEDGKIAFCEKNVQNIDEVKASHGWGDARLVRALTNQYFFPGFVDTHIHASQYPNAGIFGKSTLLDWLNTYTFPLEASLGKISKARTVYSKCVARTISHGTTTAAYYATIHVDSTNLLADICLSKGQRAFIGRVCMDSLSPDFYKDASPSSAVADTEATIAHIQKIDPTYALISPTITPRFAPSCTSSLLQQLGDLHRRTKLPIQTHISENPAECALVAKLFPDCASYAAVYDTYNLLTSQTVLAHGVHLSPSERDLIAARDAKISHCPASNSALTSGRAKVRCLMDAGITVGLGTDVSGGWSPSMLEAVRQTSLVSRHVAMDDGDAAKLSVEECLYLGTRGGAHVLGLESKIGAFEVGMEWDAQLIGLGRDNQEESGPDEKVEHEHEEHEDQGPVDLFGWETWDDRVAKWMFSGDDRNTLAVWVKGRLVHTRRQEKAT
ncbi:MAG: hypothetical protein M1837_004666 [Sclerophora amabilis]|nr:MAG: hypothetical protein M1837_004666 [Sclerophora amabilis]